MCYHSIRWAFEANVPLAGPLCGANEADIFQFAANMTSNSPSIAPSLSSLLKKEGATCTELDVSPIVSNTLFLSFYLHYGFTLGASTHVGNMIGAG